MAGSTESQRLITAGLPGHSNPALVKLGTFEVRSGGGGGSDTASFTPGGSKTPVNIGGRQTFEDVTINRVWDPQRDRPLLADLLAARATARIIVSDQPLGPDYLPIGDPIVFGGILSDVNYPDADSESNTAARLVLVMNCDGISA